MKRVAVPVFRMLIPCLLFGFLSMMFGWPTLGAIGRTKETTITTVVSVVFHIVLLFALVAADAFTLVSIAVVRSLTDVMLFVMRYLFYRKYRYQFSCI